VIELSDLPLVLALLLALVVSSSTGFSPAEVLGTGSGLRIVVGALTGRPYVRTARLTYSVQSKTAHAARAVLASSGTTTFCFGDFADASERYASPRGERKAKRRVWR